MSNIKHISIVIIAKNAERYLNECLDSVNDFTDVVMYLNKSTDTTQQIAESYENVTIIMGYFDGFGSTKNRASSFAKNDWVFSLDSDEVLSEDLLNTIKNLDLSTDNIYRIMRLNHYNNKAVRCCGWGNDRVVRLYNRSITEYLPKQVHESIDQKGLSVIQLNGLLNHYPFHNVKGLLAKADSYSELFAKNNYKQSSVFKAMSHSLVMFIKCYFLKKGFLNGTVGFLISYFNAFGTALKYLKLLDNKLTCTLIVTTYNRSDALEMTLFSVLNQQIKPNKIIIADDGSTDKTKQVIEKLQKTSPVPIIHSWQEDKGFRAARSRNLAIAKSSMNYIVIIDGDMILHPCFIKNHLDCARPKTFLQGSRVLLNDIVSKELVKNKNLSVSLSSKTAKNKLNGYYIPFISKIVSRKKRRHHKGIRSCNMSFFLSDFVSVNGFNEDFVTWGGEDSEFVERFYNAGIKRRNIKFGAIQYHLYHKRSNSNSGNDAILKNTMDQKLTWCENGFKKESE